MQNSSSLRVFPIANSAILESVPVRVQGRMLLVLRAVWMLFAVLFLGVFIIAIPVAYDAYNHPSRNILTGLTRTHVSVTTYAMYVIALQFIYAAGYCFTAFVIFWRRSDEVIGLYVSFFLLAFGIASNPIVYSLPNISSFWLTPVNVINAIGWGLFAPFFYLFPDGRFVPRWTRWMAIVSVLYQLFWIFPEQSLLYTGRWPVWLFVVVELALGSTCIFLTNEAGNQVGTGLPRPHAG